MILNNANIEHIQYKTEPKKDVFVTSHKCLINTRIVIYYIKNKTLAFRWPTFVMRQFYILQRDY